MADANRRRIRGSANAREKSIFRPATEAAPFGALGVIASSSLLRGKRIFFRTRNFARLTPKIPDFRLAGSFRDIAMIAHFSTAHF
jgi:hypothetical protein